MEAHNKTWYVVIEIEGDEHSENWLNALTTTNMIEAVAHFFGSPGKYSFVLICDSEENASAMVGKSWVPTLQTPVATMVTAKSAPPSNPSIPSLQELASPFLTRRATSPIVNQALSFVRMLNKSPHLGYHNTQHLETVAVLAAYFYIDEKSFSENQEDPLPNVHIDEVIVAALFHDADHLGCPDSEGDNIARAIAVFEDWWRVTLPEWREGLDQNTIIGLISATRFPSLQLTFKLPETAIRIIRSADIFCNLMCIYSEEEWVQVGLQGHISPAQVVTGLGIEQQHHGKMVPAVSVLYQQTLDFFIQQLGLNHWVSKIGLWREAGIMDRVRGVVAPWVGQAREIPQFRISELEWVLHAQERHPDFEYTETTSQRKGDSIEPQGIGWRLNAARPMERDDYTDTEFWLRTKVDARRCAFAFKKLPEIRLLKMHRSQLWDALIPKLGTRVKDGPDNREFYSKGEYVERASDILNESGHATIFYFCLGEYFTDQSPDQPIKFRYHDGKEGQKYGYLVLNLKEWRLLLDLSQPQGDVHFQHMSRGKTWFTWSVDMGPLPINPYELNELIETYL